MLNRDRSASRSVPDVDWSLELQAPRGRRRAPGAGRPGAAAAVLLGGLMAPVVAVGLFTHAGSADHGGLWQCPMLEATGVPCPGCGATRAFVHFANGDFAGALHYNWSWLVLWLAVAGWALVMVLRAVRGRPVVGPVAGEVGALLRTRPWAAAAVPVAILLPAWSIALANLGYIR